MGRNGCNLILEINVFCTDYCIGKPIENPTGATAGSLRVFRGGSWNFYPQDCRAANRNYNTPTIRRSNLGFRVVLSQ